MLLFQQQPKLFQINKLIAGNIYISAGGRGKSSKFLMELLHAIQEECCRIRQQQQQQHPKKDNGVVLVHAFADPCYDRSSLHLAGNSWAVAQVTTLISRLALQHNNTNTCFTTTFSNTETTVPSPTAHPNVGFIDHISLMPLLLPHNTAVSTFLSHFSNHQSDPKEEQQDSCTQAARYVGEFLTSEMGCIVHYYGSASIDHAPLAKVRRERTNFFQSGALAASSQSFSIGSSSSSSSSSDTPSSSNTVVCVGSPGNFVENFNIRLSVTVNNNNNKNNNSNTTGKKVAVSLCRTLRERDGGLLGVEALTLPYSSSSHTNHNTTYWEVACNLLSPHLGSKDAIRQRTMEWLTQYNNSENTNSNVITIEDMYSVGTTQEQCLNILLLLLREDVEAAVHKHDQTVANNFFSYLHS